MKLASNDRNREEEKTDDMMIMTIFSLMSRPLPIFERGLGMSHGYLLCVQHYNMSCENFSFAGARR